MNKIQIFLCNWSWIFNIYCNCSRCWKICLLRNKDASLRFNIDLVFILWFLYWYWLIKVYMYFSITLCFLSLFYKIVLWSIYGLAIHKETGKWFACPWMTFFSPIVQNVKVMYILTCFNWNNWLLRSFACLNKGNKCLRNE
jgi:hypothetical protein